MIVIRGYSPAHFGARRSSYLGKFGQIWAFGAVGGALHSRFSELEQAKRTRYTTPMSVSELDLIIQIFFEANALVGSKSSNITGLEEKAWTRYLTGETKMGPGTAKTFAAKVWKALNQPGREEEKNTLLAFIERQAGHGFAHIIPTEWNRVTFPAFCFKVVQISKLAEHKRSRPQEQPDVKLLVEFLNRLRRNGLKSCLAFSPRHFNGDLAAFCLPARAFVEEHKVRSSESRRKELLSFPGTFADDAYDFPTREMTGLQLNHVLRQFPRIALLADPGAGKSTGLWLFVNEICLAAIQSIRSSKRSPSKEVVPLFLPLGRLAGPAPERTKLIDQAVRYVLGVADLGEVAGNTLEGWLGRKVESKEYILLLDALDELPPKLIPWVRQTLDRLDDIRIVVSGRKQVDPRCVLREYTLSRLAPLNRTVVEDFTQKYFAHHPDGSSLATSLLNEIALNRAADQLVRNPFMIGAMCHWKSADQRQRLPATRTELLAAALRLRLEEGNMMRGCTTGAVDVHQKLDILSTIAWTFQEEQPTAMAKDELLNVLGRMNIATSSGASATSLLMLEDLIADGVLVCSDATRGSTGEAYRFSFRPFQEYCLARYIGTMLAKRAKRPGTFERCVRGRAKAWGRLRDWPSNFRPLNQHAWDEIWPLAAGCMKDNDALLQALVHEWAEREDVCSSRVVLLACVLSEYFGVNASRPALLARWTPLLDTVCDRLIELAGQPFREERFQTVLARLPASIVFPKLTAAIDSRANERSSAASYFYIMGEIDDRSARQYLHSVLADPRENPWRRMVSAIDLGVRGGATAQKELCEWLKLTPPPDVSSASVSEQAAARWADNEGFGGVWTGCMKGLACLGGGAGRPAFLDEFRALRESCLRGAAKLIAVDEEQATIMGMVLRTNLRILEECIGISLDTCWDEFMKEICLTLGLCIRRSSKSLLQAGFSCVIRQCARAVGALGESEQAHQMLGLLNERDLPPHDVLELCEAVARCGDEAAHDELRRLASDHGDEALSQAARVSLLPLADDALLGLLLDRVQVSPASEWESWFLREALKACETRASSSCLQFAIRALKSPEREEDAVRVLVCHGGSAALSALKEALSTLDYWAARALAAFGLALERDELGVKWLFATLRSKEASFHTKRCIAWYLAHLDRQDARKALGSAFGDRKQSEGVRGACLEAIQLVQLRTGWRMVGRGWERP
jgi:hypothetical protein